VDGAGNAVTLLAADWAALHFQNSFRVANAAWPAAVSLPPRNAALLEAAQGAHESGRERERERDNAGERVRV
jgi:hypothetical protein